MSPTFRRTSLASLLFGAGGALVMACSSDVPAVGLDPDERDASANEDAGAPVDPKDDAGGGGTDAGADAADECTYAPPVLDGAGPCGTVDFGADAVSFTKIAGDDDGVYSGTTLAPGIYDAVLAERGSDRGGSWRETFATDGTRFTRMRQLDLGTGSGVGEIKYWSGTLAYDGQQIQLTYDCAKSGAADADAKSDTLPSDAVLTDCEGRFRYGATGVRVTLHRR